MTDIADDPRFQRDRELYRVISRAQFCPVVWKITPEEGATLGERLAKLFPSPAGPMLRVRFEFACACARCRGGQARAVAPRNPAERQAVSMMVSCATPPITVSKI